MDLLKMGGFLQAIKEGHNTTTKILNRTGIYSLNYNINQLKRLELIDVDWSGNRRVFTLTKRGEKLLKALDYKIQTPN